MCFLKIKWFFWGKPKTANNFKIGNKVYLKDEYEEMKLQKKQYNSHGITWFGYPTVYLIEGYNSDGSYRFKFEGKNNKPFKPDRSCSVRINSFTFEVFPYFDDDFIIADSGVTNDSEIPFILNPIPINNE